MNNINVMGRLINIGVDVLRYFVFIIFVNFLLNLMIMMIDIRVIVIYDLIISKKVIKLEVLWLWMEWWIFNLDFNLLMCWEGEKDIFDWLWLWLGMLL